MSKPSSPYFWGTDSSEMLALISLQTYFHNSLFKVHDGEVQSHLSPASLTKPYHGPQLVWGVNVRPSSNTNFREIATFARATRHYTCQNFMTRKTSPFQKINFQKTLIERRMENYYFWLVIPFLPPKQMGSWIMFDSAKFTPTEQTASFVMELTHLFIYRRHFVLCRKRYFLLSQCISCRCVWEHFLWSS